MCILYGYMAIDDCRTVSIILSPRLDDLHIKELNLKKIFFKFSF